MAGPVEEGTKAVGSYISALVGQPVLLVQSLIIAGVVFILYAQGSKAFDERKELLKSVFDAQNHVREILSQCIVPPGQQRGELKDGYKPASAESVPLPLPAPLRPLRLLTEEYPP